MAVNDQLSRSRGLLGTSGLEPMLELHVRANSFIREIAVRLTLRRENDDLLVSWRRLAISRLMAVRTMNELNE